MNYKDRDAGVPRQKTNYLTQDEQRGQEDNSDRDSETPSYEQDEEKQASAAALECLLKRKS